MKQIKLVLLIIILAVFVVFVIQNFDTVTIKLFKWSISLPMAITIAGIYIHGMFTGGLMWSNIKRLANPPGKNNS